MKRELKAMALAWALTPCLAFATTWYVDGTNGSDDNVGTSQGKAKATIQAAIDVSIDNDTILVAPGTYSAIKTDNKNITIQSTGGAIQTIIDGGGTNRCAWMAIDTGDENWSTNRWSTKLIGFTLTNGYAIDYGEERGMVLRLLEERLLDVLFEIATANEILCLLKK